MSFSGAGVFNINSTGQPVVAGTTISSSTFNALTADLATGLSTCITKDGQQTVTANIPFANYRLTAVGAGTAATDAANVGQVQSRASGLITVTGTDTLVGTMSPTLSAYATGNQFAFVAANTNTTTVTLNIDGLGAKAVTRDGSTALVAGDITANKAHLVVYDGTRFQLLNSPSFTDLKATTLAVSGATTLSSNVTISGGTSITPSSGTALTLSPPSGQLAILVNDTAAGGIRCVNSGNTSGFDVGLLGGTSVADAYLYNRNIASGSLILGTKNSSRVNIGIAGNVTISSPDTTGHTLLVNPGTGSGYAALYVIGSLQLQGTVTPAAAVSALFNYEAPNTRFYVGDGTGFYFRFSKRVSSVTTDLVTVSDGFGGATIFQATGVGGAAGQFNSASSFVCGINSTSGSGGWLAFQNSGTAAAYIGTGSATIPGAALGDLGIAVAGTNGIRFAYNGGSNVALTISGSNGSVNVAYGFNITGTGGFYNSASKFGMDFTSGVTRFYSSGADASTRGAYDLRITDSVGTLDRSVFAINNQGAVSIAAPVSGTALAVTGTAAGTAALRLDTTATTGAQTATWTAPTNKPGAASGVVSKWIPVNLDGTTYYIPAWT